ncbi:MAG: M14 family metallopeptidase [Flavobacterium sp.]
MDFEHLFAKYKEHSLKGRYVTLNHILPLIEKFSGTFTLTSAGTSVQGESILKIVAGNGPVRVLIWSQMHGNESTTTKAVFDFLNFLAGDDEEAKRMLSHFTFLILPMLNPDGAKAYTRVNANGIDLNRDSVDLSQPESRALRNAFEEFRPHWCYNMHDQRTIFGVGNTHRPATMSFLSPAYNETRDVNDCRLKAMGVIVAMNETLQHYMPGQVGRFDDSFNINCIGDMFQSLGVPTVLFEAGHYPGDYEREITRKYVFFALLSGLQSIYENVIVVKERERYFEIPQNKISFYDMIWKNVKINYENKEIITNFASQYKEALIDNSVIFEAIISEIGNLNDFSSHREYDCKGLQFTGGNNSHTPVIGQRADFTIGGRQFSNGAEVG